MDQIQRPSRPPLSPRRKRELIESIRDIKSLLKDIEAGHHIPKKFRGFPFVGTQLQKDYVIYLKYEIRRCETLRDGPSSTLPQPRAVLS